MKNTFKLFFCFIVLVIAGFLFACNGNEGGNGGQDGDTDAVIKWVNEEVGTNVADDITLPTTCPKVAGSKIEWSCQMPWYMDNSGKIVDRERKLTEVVFDFTVTCGSKVDYGTKTFMLAPIDLETASQRFLSQMPTKIYENINPTTSFYNGSIQVVWESSNQDVLDNEGVYTKPVKDTEITISFVVKDDFNSRNDTYNIVVQGKTALDLFDEASYWLTNVFFTERYLTSDIELPSTVEGSDVQIVWSSSDETIVSSTGKVNKSLFERYCYLTANLISGEHKGSYKFICKVQAKDISGMSDNEILEEFLGIIGAPEIGVLNIGLYSNTDQTYNFLPFYQNVDSKIVEEICPISDQNRPGIVKTSTEYITVHDTANNSSGANAKMHSQYVNNGGGGTSWHYSVDQDGCYHQVPDNEVAYHAGDGRRVFALVDTGIKATAVWPNVTLEDGYYYINGKNTKLRPYDDQAGTMFDMTDYPTSKINKLGVIVEIGSNGNYFMGKTYYNSGYGLVSNFGGNRNSIGIESCVNAGSNYELTVRVLAKLVAELCIQNNLSVDRVQGHHYFSGKPCPNAILTADYWYTFKNLVALEKFAKEHLSKYNFTWTSNSADLSNTGMISSKVTKGTTLNYSVKVTNGSTQVMTKSYSTIVR